MEMKCHADIRVAPTSDGSCAILSGMTLLKSTSDLARLGAARPSSSPTAHRWPLRIDEGGTTHSGNPWVGMVRESLGHYAEGRLNAASRMWLPEIVWRLTGTSRFSGDHTGREGILRYHRSLADASAGTFQQSLIALDGTGPLVEAHLRSIAWRGRTRIDMTTLVVFELSSGGIRRITELPGDPPSWDRFWGPR